MPHPCAAPDTRKRPMNAFYDALEQRSLDQRESELLAALPL